MIREAGISTDIWDINGPHLFRFPHAGGETLLVGAVTGEKGSPWPRPSATQRILKRRKAFEQGRRACSAIWRRAVKKGSADVLGLSPRCIPPWTGRTRREAAGRSCLKAKERGFDACLQAHRDAWERIWDRCEITLEGDEAAALALRASQYHLNCIAPRHADNLSIPGPGPFRPDLQGRHLLGFRDLLLSHVRPHPAGDRPLPAALPHRDAARRPEKSGGIRLPRRVLRLGKPGGRPGGLHEFQRGGRVYPPAGAHLFSGQADPHQRRYRLRPAQLLRDHRRPVAAAGGRRAGDPGVRPLLSEPGQRPRGLRYGGFRGCDRPG